MLQKLFAFEPTSMSIKKEVIGGLTTFLAMAYILAVNPSILSATGMDSGAIFTTTCIASAVATLVMAFYAKLPYALAPGMGLNAFFAFTIVLTMGYTWQFALTAVLIEGIIFLVLTLTGLRQQIVSAIPWVLRRAISPGIGMFITFVGLKSAGIVTGSESTFVTLGNMKDPAVLLGLAGLIITTILLYKNVTGALLLGILITTMLGIPLGVTKIERVMNVPPSMSPICWQFEWENVFTLDMVVCVFTFLCVDMFDTIGTLIGVANRAGMVEADGTPTRLNQAFMADAIGTMLGAALGTSTVTTFVESSTGINAGGRSGLTAFTTALCFLTALFFSPLFLAIPSEATAAALILVGVMMMSDLRNIDFSDYITAVPCYVLILFMPLTYSISDGILMGVIFYVALHVLSGRMMHETDARNNMTWGTVLLAILFILRYAFL